MEDGNALQGQAPDSDLSVLLGGEGTAGETVLKDAGEQADGIVTCQARERKHLTLLGR